MCSDMFNVICYATQQAKTSLLHVALNSAHHGLRLYVCVFRQKEIYLKDNLRYGKWR